MTYRIAFGTLFLLLALALQAERDAERDMLLRVSLKLQSLNSLIAEAEKEQDTSARVTFRYDWLKRDLQLIQSGVDSYLTDTHLQPRSFEKLQGIYHQ